MQVSIGLVRPAWIKSSSLCVSAYTESTSTKGSSPRVQGAPSVSYSALSVRAHPCIYSGLVGAHPRVQGARSSWLGMMLVGSPKIGASPALR